MDNGASSYRRFLAGDDNGFVEIVRDHKDGLILYLNGIVGNISVAEELAEDTFVKIGVKRPRFSGKSSFRTWLYAIGRNTAIDYLRKQAKRKTVSVDECAELAEEEEPETSYIREERRLIVHKALKKLKAEYRQVLWLVYFEGFSAKEAALVMKKNVHTIENLTYRAKKSLRAELLKEGFDYENL